MERNTRLQTLGSMHGLCKLTYDDILQISLDMHQGNLQENAEA